MKLLFSILATSLVVFGDGTSVYGQSPPAQAPTWVASLTNSSVSWDRATLSWEVGLAMGSGFGPLSDPVTVVLESRKEGAMEWTELGRLPLAPGNHTNQTPSPDPPAILLPERILAPPPASTATGGVVGNLPSFSFTAYYTHHHLESNAAYEYRLKAINAHGEAPYSEILVVRTLPLPPPTPPYDLFVRNLAGPGLEVLWTRSSLASEFLVERKEADGTWLAVSVVDGSFHSWTDTLVLPGQRYTYRVSGRNASGDSDPGPAFSTVAHRLRQVLHEPVEIGLSAVWLIQSGVAIAPRPDDANENAIWFSGTESRSLTTRPLVFLIGGFLEFDFWSNLPFNVGSNLLVQATLDGKTWTTLGQIDPEKNRGRWRSISIELPASWSSPGVQFRFHQTSHSGEGHETWAIRDIRVLAIQGMESAPPTVRIHEPRQLTTVQTRRTVRLAGTAADNRQLLRWAWSLNGGPWKTTGLQRGRNASWFAIVPRLKRGHNTIKVSAYDVAGNLSSVKSRVIRVR